MKKSLKCLIAATASVMTTGGAFAVSNMENPLYMPKNREVYLKTGAAVMYKRSDDTKALKEEAWIIKTNFLYGVSAKIWVMV